MTRISLSLLKAFLGIYISPLISKLLASLSFRGIDFIATSGDQILDLVRTTNDREANLMKSWGIVKVADLEKAYRNVSDKELRSTMQTIIETSKEANKQKESDEVTK